MYYSLLLFATTYYYLLLLTTTYSYYLQLLLTATTYSNHLQQPLTNFHVLTPRLSLLSPPPSAQVRSAAEAALNEVSALYL